MKEEVGGKMYKQEMKPQEVRVTFQHGHVAIFLWFGVSH